MIKIGYNKETKRFSVEKHYSDNNQVYIVIGLTPDQRLLDKEISANSSTDAIKQVENVTSGKGGTRKCTRLKAFKAKKERRQVGKGSFDEVWSSTDADKYRQELRDYINSHFQR